MSKIDEFSGLIAKCPPAVADALIDRICGTEWATAEEREKAQGLVARLERLKRRAEAPQENGTSYDGGAVIKKGRARHPVRSTP
jgi:hypothetical protein